MSAGWSWYVIFLVVLNIGGCAWLLWWTMMLTMLISLPTADTWMRCAISAGATRSLLLKTDR